MRPKSLLFPSSWINLRCQTSIGHLFKDLSAALKDIAPVASHLLKTPSYEVFSYAEGLDIQQCDVKRTTGDLVIPPGCKASHMWFRLRRQVQEGVFREEDPIIEFTLDFNAHRINVVTAYWVGKDKPSLSRHHLLVHWDRTEVSGFIEVFDRTAISTGDTSARASTFEAPYEDVWVVAQYLLAPFLFTDRKGESE